MRHVGLLPVLALAIVGAAPAVARPAGVRAEVPIRPVTLSDHVRRYAVELTVDGQPIEAQLDTGSTGLRILASALHGPAARARGNAVHYSYGSGVELEGHEVLASVGFAGGPAMPISIQRVDAVRCTQRRPDCPAERVAPGDYRIGGDGLPGQGFVAIIGTGLHDNVVPNPLIAMGVHRWIVELPRANEAAGRLVLDPGADVVSGYRRFDVLPNTNQIAACIVRNADNRRLCGPAMVDTGASGLRVQGGTPADIWPNGTPATIALGDSSGVAEFAVTIGRRDEASGMFAMPHRVGSDILTLNLGLAPFFHWSVLFDADRRQIGVLDRSN